MAVLGLTGGIATGKSTFTRLFLGQLPMEHFDSDRCVHELLARDEAVRDSVLAAFGSAAMDAGTGRPDRQKLRGLVFQDEARRKALEGILHPRVRTSWTARVAAAREAGTWLLVDIPLLYETEAASFFDRVITVACDPRTQQARMTSDRGLAPELARQIISAQAPLGEKIQKADYVIWNDSTVPNLDGQSRILADALRRRFGRNAA